MKMKKYIITTNAIGTQSTRKKLKCCNKDDKMKLNSKIEFPNSKKR